MENQQAIDYLPNYLVLKNAELFTGLPYIEEEMTDVDKRMA